jgi:hypothetical protein
MPKAKNTKALPPSVVLPRVKEQRATLESMAPKKGPKGKKDVQ